MKKVLVNGQWQGGADISTMHGAEEIENLYLKNVDYEKATVSKDEKNLPVENDIVGYEILEKQMEQVFQSLKTEQPEKLFTIGGGCDADFPSIAYMNEKYNGDLKILYFDAHGDINSPEESESKLFYGMPLRCLIENSDGTTFPFVKSKLKSDQIILIGARELNSDEIKFINENKTQRITVEDLANRHIDLEKILAPNNEKVYIHLDLDVLEPQKFPHVPLPSAGGITAEKLKDVLKIINEKSCVVGFGVFEYKPCGKENELLKELIRYGIDF